MFPGLVLVTTESKVFALPGNSGPKRGTAEQDAFRSFAHAPPAPAAAPAAAAAAAAAAALAAALMRSLDRSPNRPYQVDRFSQAWGSL